jgi:hypothetical protein
MWHLRCFGSLKSQADQSRFQIAQIAPPKPHLDLEKNLLLPLAEPQRTSGPVGESLVRQKKCVTKRVKDS